MTPNRLPLIMFAAVGLVVVAVVGFATDSWAVFFIALAVHLIATAVVMKGVFDTVGTGSESDARSRRLDRQADAAVGDGNRDVESEIEALKREPAAR